MTVVAGRTSEVGTYAGREYGCQRSAATRVGAGSAGQDVPGFEAPPLSFEGRRRSRFIERADARRQVVGPISLDGELHRHADTHACAKHAGVRFVDGRADSLR